MSPVTVQKEDPYRADAAVVYRYLRDHPGVTVVDMANALFPSPDEGPATTLAYLAKRSVRRVLDSLVWMRHQKVVLTAVPAEEPGGMTTFWLGERVIDLNRVALARAVVLTSEAVRDTQVAQQGDDSLGGEVMGIYHP